MLQPEGDWYSFLPKKPDSNVQGSLLDDARIPLVLITENNTHKPPVSSVTSANSSACPSCWWESWTPCRIPPSPVPRPLLLIDLDYLQVDQQEQWSKAICHRFSEASAVLLNAPTSTDKGAAADVASYQRALLPPGQPGSPGDRHTQGVAGEYWIPRHLLYDLVDYYRKNGQPAPANAADRPRAGDSPPPDDGASNARIADNLFVSRSHRPSPTSTTCSRS